MKQSAVEWLAEQVKSVKWAFADVTDRNAIVEQAKQMEREQIEEAYLTDRFPCSDEDARQYFEDTYIIKK